MANNYSVLVGVELDTKNVQQQLNKASKDVKIALDTKDAVNNTNNLKDSVDDLSLSYQAANAILRESIDIISTMVGQVYELDSALTEFKKVSDLSGNSLDNYVSKLSEMGASVARTGKPKCLSRGVGMVNQHRELFKIQ